MSDEIEAQAEVEAQADLDVKIESPTPLDQRLTRWFNTKKWKPFGFQREVWDAYARGESGLIHAATGTGKTYAAWLGPVIEAMQELEKESQKPRVMRRRADANRRHLDIALPAGQRDRRRGLEARKPEVIEIDMSASEWDALSDLPAPKK